MTIRSRTVIVEGHGLIVKTFKFSDSSFKQHSLRAVKTGVCRLYNKILTLRLKASYVLIFLRATRSSIFLMFTFVMSKLLYL